MAWLNGSYWIPVGTRGEMTPGTAFLTYGNMNFAVRHTSLTFRALPKQIAKGKRPTKIWSSAVDYNEGIFALRSVFFVKRLSRTLFQILRSWFRRLANVRYDVFVPLSFRCLSTGRYLHRQLRIYLWRNSLRSVYDKWRLWFHNNHLLSSSRHKRTHRSWIWGISRCNAFHWIHEKSLRWSNLRHGTSFVRNNVLSIPILFCRSDAVYEVTNGNNPYPHIYYRDVVSGQWINLTRTDLGERTGYVYFFALAFQTDGRPVVAYITDSELSTVHLMLYDENGSQWIDAPSIRHSDMPEYETQEFFFRDGHHLVVLESNSWI